MENVSPAWKEQFDSELLPESFVEITYEVSRPGVNDDYNESDNGQLPWSSAEFSSPDVATKYATLEHNLWTLDGTFKVLPSNPPYNNGKFVSSAISGSDGVFTAPPIIVLEWEELVTGAIPGITIQWSKAYNEYPKSYSIKIYNGDTLLEEITETNNSSVVSTPTIELENFNKIEVKILKWNLPHRYARIEMLYIGFINTYTGTDLMSYSHEDFIDLLSGSLPKSSITFSLDNSDGKWNILSPSGLSEYLAERQALSVKYGMNINGEPEWINAGRFFLDEWDTPSNGLEATFTARDMLTFMNDIYVGTRQGTLYTIATAAITQIDLPDGATYFFDQTALGVSVDFSADTSEYTVAEILQMIANAASCIIHQDRTGCLRIEPVPITLTDYVISQDNSYSHPEFTLSKPLKSVSVNSGLGVAINSDKGEVQTADNPLVATSAHAGQVALWIKNTLAGRKTVSGEYRADVRLSAGDTVTVENKFSQTGDHAIITLVKYNFSGAWKGTFEGRLV